MSLPTGIDILAFVAAQQFTQPKTTGSTAATNVSPSRQRPLLPGNSDSNKSSENNEKNDATKKQQEHGNNRKRKVKTRFGFKGLKPPLSSSVKRPRVGGEIKLTKEPRLAGSASTTSSRNSGNSRRKQQQQQASRSFLGWFDGDDDDTSKLGRSASPSTGMLMEQPTAEELDACASDRSRAAVKTWYERLHELERYKQQHGHCNVPQNYLADKRLANWVNKQRMEKNRFDDNKSGKNGVRSADTSMTERRIALLEHIGFTWSKRKGEVSWEASYEELRAYTAKYGHCQIPTKNGALGRWVSSQRANYKNKTITPERMAKLQKIGFKWSMKEPTAAELAAARRSTSPKAPGATKTSATETATPAAARAIPPTTLEAAAATATTKSKGASKSQGNKNKAIKVTSSAEQQAVETSVRVLHTLRTSSPNKTTPEATDTTTKAIAPEAPPTVVSDSTASKVPLDPPPPSSKPTLTPILPKPADPPLVTLQQQPKPTLRGGPTRRRDGSDGDSTNTIATAATTVSATTASPSSSTVTSTAGADKSGAVTDTTIAAKTTTAIGKIGQSFRNLRKRQKAS